MHGNMNVGIHGYVFVLVSSCSSPGQIICSKSGDEREVNEYRLSINVRTEIQMIHNVNNIWSDDIKWQMIILN
jgi:hypothetical protein